MRMCFEEYEICDRYISMCSKFRSRLRLTFTLTDPIDYLVYSNRPSSSDFSNKHESVRPHSIARPTSRMCSDPTVPFSLVLLRPCCLVVST